MTRRFPVAMAAYAVAFSLCLHGCGDSGDEGLPSNPKPSVTQEQMRELSTMKVPAKPGLPKQPPTPGATP
jgi:hypothetical protein